MKLRQEQKHKLEMMLDEAEIIVDELQNNKLNKKERIEAWHTLEAIFKLMRWEVRDE
tara:strand:+ start:87 stop:257 length:171 start_codon:yes stop_codon:yes gene_type:complete